MLGPACPSNNLEAVTVLIDIGLPWGRSFDSQLLTYCIFNRVL